MIGRTEMREGKTSESSECEALGEGWQRGGGWVNVNI